MSKKERVISILNEVKPTRDLSAIEDIVEGGYLDSFELMFLITKLSEEFNIEIDVAEVVPENFNSVAAIAEMVEKLEK